MSFGTLLVIIFVVWIAYQLGKINEIGKREDKEAEDIVDRIKDGLFNGSFKEAHGWITIGRAAPSEWSDSLKEKVTKRLLEEARRAGELH